MGIQKISAENSDACVRCGDFGPFPIQIFGRGVCEDCLATDEGGLLLRFKREKWGARDFYGSLVGLSMLCYLPYWILAASSFFYGPSAAMASVFVLTTVLLIVSLAYALHYRWARMALIILSIAAPASIFVALSLAERDFHLGTFGFMGILTVLALAISLSAWRDVRNKLAFKIDVDQAELEAYYLAKLSNPWAASGEVFGVLGMVLPIFAPPGLILSLKGLLSVDLSVWPPVSGRSTAINGIVTSLIGLLWGSVFFIAMFL